MGPFQLKTFCDSRILWPLDIKLKLIPITRKPQKEDIQAQDYKRGHRMKYADPMRLLGKNICYFYSHLLYHTSLLTVFQYCIIIFSHLFVTWKTDASCLSLWGRGLEVMTASCEPTERRRGGTYSYCEAMLPVLCSFLATRNLLAAPGSIVHPSLSP